MKATIEVAILSLVFFIWGFMTVLNDILIPWLKQQFDLSNTASMTVQLAFFGAYFIGSVYFYILAKRQKDPVSVWGYKKTIAAGLFIAALGTALFIPASMLDIFPFYLLALFVLGLGFTLLQISSNPYMGLIGSIDHATERLNLAQGFNSLGTALAPILGGIFILGALDGVTQIIFPYLVFTLILLVLGTVILKSPLKDPISKKEHIINKSAFKIKQVRWTMLGIFLYVGAEVTIGSKMVELFQVPTMGSWTEVEAKSLLGLYWGGALVGRFMAAVQKKNDFTFKRISYILMTGLFLLSLIFIIQWFDGSIDLSFLFPFIGFVVLHFLLSMSAKFMDERQVSLFAGMNLLLVLVVLFNSGIWLTYIIIGIGFFNSILWSHIFTLGTRNLKDKTSDASSLFIMMIVGGALIPLLHGVLIDFLEFLNIDNALQWSYAIVIPSYFYISWYGIKYPKFQYNYGK